MIKAVPEVQAKRCEEIKGTFVFEKRKLTEKYQSGETIPLSAEFISTDMKNMTDLQLKVYLYLLCCSEKEDINIAEMAKCLGVKEETAASAYNAICNLYGIDRALDRMIGPASCSKEINIKCAEDENFIKLVAQINEIRKIMMSPRYFETVQFMFEKLGLEREVILALVAYCVNYGKDTISYISKKAIEWSTLGIRSVQQADAKIKEYMEFDQSLKKVDEKRRINNLKKGEVSQTNYEEEISCDIAEILRNNRKNWDAI